MDHIDKNSVGFAIRDIRNKADITADELSFMTDISATHIAKIETGKISKPSFDIVISLAKALAKLDVVQNYEVDLDIYNSEFACIIRSFIDYADTASEYKNRRIEKHIGSDENLSSLDDDEFIVFKKFAKYKKNSQIYESEKDGFFLFLEKVLDELHYDDFGDYGVISSKGRYDFIQSISKAFNVDASSDFSGFKKYKTKLNKDIELLLKDTDTFKSERSIIILFKEILRLWFLTMYRKKEDIMFLDDE